VTMRAIERSSPRGIKTWRGEATALRVGGALLTALVWIGAIACVFPLVWMVVSSFRPDQSFIVSPFPTTVRELTLSNYNTVFSIGTFPTGFKNSAIQVAIILATTLFFCPLAGFGFAKFRFRGQRFFFGLMMLTLFFVPLTQYIPLLVEMNTLGWLDTYQALVLPLVITSFGVFFMTGVIRAIPDELLQAARVDGCGHLRTWWRIVMPLILPAQVSLAVVTFLTSYNDYFWPLLVLRSPSMQTIQIDLALMSTDPRLPSVAATSNFGPYLAGCTLVILPTVIIFLVMQRYFLRGVLQGSVKG
jgi:multiple sugar transport system permease protein